MLCLLYGEERYLLETRLKKLKKEFGEMINGINFVQIDADTISELISDIETPAFGYPTKLIVAKNTGLFKKEKRTSKSKSAKEDKKKVDGQFDMFNYKLAEVAHELDMVNLNELTPIDALNTLVRIKEKMK